MAINPLIENPLILEGSPLFISPAAETREKLLSAAARASRLLLESPDAMKAMPDVLRLLGEAAEVHRTALALAEIDAGGERWLVIKDEWISEELMDSCNGETCGIEPDQYSDIYCSMLQTGKSVLYCRDTMPEAEAVSITSDKARSSAIVPILVDGEYVGVIGFDDWRRARQFDSSIVSALEIAAGLVGAALYRERLLETMRRERERAAEERLTQLDRANATLRANLNRLAGNPDVKDFIANMLIDASRQLDAAACYAAGIDPEGTWRIFLYVEDGRVGDPPFPATVPSGNPGLADLLEKSQGPVFFELEKLDKPLWPEATLWHQRSGHKTAYLLPLVFGERNVGFLTLVFNQSEPLTADRMQVVLALAHQATLAIGMKKLGLAAKEAAVLAERNRIGQEIHDGLAQGFTGILMQLGAAEEAMGDCAIKSPLPSILTRIRALAKEGLAEARRSVMALRPEQSRRIGLEFALRQLAERSSILGRVDCSFEGGMTGEGLAPEHQHELLRIAQEAVSNAVRHAHPSNVRIGLQEGPTMWVLTVTDDGQGMEELSQYVAQGFGLTNMRERASAIGGQWRVHSKLGKGTQVVVSLPPSGRDMSTAAKLPTRKISVILADDHPVVRDGLAAIVNQQPDMQVVAEAGDGAEALELYELHKPDVMVLDLRMPKLDGAAVVARVLEKYPKACLLIMTTYDGDEDIFRSLSQGAKGYLLKDAPRQEILSAIRAVADDRPYTSSSVAAKALQRMAKPSLTQRELTVLQLVAEGRSNKDIARRLDITEGTAKTHVKAILGKLDAISRTEAVAVAAKRGLIHLS